MEYSKPKYTSNISVKIKMSCTQRDSRGPPYHFGEKNYRGFLYTRCLFSGKQDTDIYVVKSRHVVVKQNVMLPFYRLYKENQVNKKHHFIGSVVKKARQEKKILLWGGSVNKKSDFIGFTKNDVEK